jgi:hypothetical protein
MFWSYWQKKFPFRTLFRTTYVLVSSQEIAIDLYRKGNDDRWEILTYRPGAIVELQSVILSFPVEQIYRGIDFSEAVI